MQAESIGRVLGSIYSARIDDGHWSAVVSHLLDIADADVGALFALNKADGGIVNTCTHHKYVDAAHVLSPDMANDPLSPSQRLQRHFQHATLSCDQDPFHIRSDVNACVVKVNEDADTANFLAVGCLAPRDAANVADVLTFLRPHIASSLQRIKDDEIQRMDDLLGIVPTAALILTSRGDILRTNEQMEALLAEKDGLWRESGSLRCFSDQDGEALLQLIRQNHTPDAAPGFCLARIARKSGKRPLRAQIRPTPRLAPRRAPSLLALVSFSASEPRLKVSTGTLQQLFHLTRAESNLCRELVEAGNLNQAAEKCRLTIGSARQYLKRIFTKTNTEGQVSLVSMLMALPISNSDL